ncbi:MAG: hypothetical protein Ta2A_06350 [Treponemataceae bacterium]|nr:MAG: hypothetical protein Ta2A_06350 [Treponemataceae bacterium]
MPIVYTVKPVKKILIAFLAFLFLTSASVWAKDFWAHPYVGLGLQSYGLFPDAVSETFGQDTVSQTPGIRAIGGIEVNNLFFGVEAGWTLIGYDPNTGPWLLIQANLIPMKFIVAYELPFFRGAALIPEVGTGFMFNFSQVYPDMDARADETPESRTSIALIASIGMTVRFGWLSDHLFVFAHAGFDGIIATGGTKGLPSFSAGVMIYPFGIPDVEQNVKAKRQNVLFYNPIYFAEDTHEILQRYKPILDAAGELLQNESNTVVKIRGFAEPGKNIDDQLALSERRARHCAAYLQAYYMIREDRITIEFYGNKVAPDNAIRKANETYRVVELLVYENHAEDDDEVLPSSYRNYAEENR